MGELREASFQLSRLHEFLPYELSDRIQTTPGCQDTFARKPAPMTFSHRCVRGGGLSRAEGSGARSAARSIGACAVPGL